MDRPVPLYLLFMHAYAFRHSIYIGLYLVFVCVPYSPPPPLPGIAAIPAGSLLLTNHGRKRPTFPPLPSNPIYLCIHQPNQSLCLQRGGHPFCDAGDRGPVLNNPNSISSPSLLQLTELKEIRAHEGYQHIYRGSWVSHGTVNIRNLWLSSQPLMLAVPCNNPFSAMSYSAPQLYETPNNPRIRGSKVITYIVEKLLIRTILGGTEG